MTMANVCTIIGNTNVRACAIAIATTLRGSIRVISFGIRSKSENLHPFPNETHLNTVARGEPTVFVYGH